MARKRDVEKLVDVGFGLVVGLIMAIVYLVKKIFTRKPMETHEYYQQKLSNDLYENERKQPGHKLISVKFQDSTRVALVEVEEVKDYRTIEKYVTRDYVKYPIYSPWKQKTKRINRSVRLTSDVLESLNHHSDCYIRMFAYDIILHINKQELFPSWFKKIKYKKDYEQTLKNLDNEKLSAENVLNTKLKELDEEKNNYTDLLENILLPLPKLQKKKEKLEKKQTHKKLSKRKAKKLLILTYSTKNLLDKKFEIEIKLESINDNIQKLKNSFNERVLKIGEKRIKALDNFNVNSSNIKPLERKIVVSEEFTLLKFYLDKAYEKIVGCYIIHNTEKDKYYVGQSKDVLRRLKQHFKGTTPVNPIFIDDYNNSELSDKNDIFEIKIIECATKDELDRTEKELIEQYDSKNWGYNKTSGNK